jgi:hypothetical protein
MGVAPFTSRPLLYQSITADTVTRLIVAFWFCSIYVRLSRLDRFGLYSNKHWRPSDVSPREKPILIGVGVFFGVMGAIFTAWTIAMFLPVIWGLMIVFAILNGAIIMWPLVTQFWVMKI